MPARGQGLSLLAVSLVVALAAPTMPTLAAQHRALLQFVSVIINDIEQPGLYLAFDDDGRFLIEPDAYEGLGLVLPAVETRRFEGREFLPLDAVPGLRVSFDERRLALVIDCAATCFPAQVLGGEPLYAAPDPAPLGAYLNYDLNAERNTFDDLVDGLGDIGIFSDAGHGQFGFAGRDLTGVRTFTRLETRWTFDFPESRESLRIGDAITEPGGWGQANRFGGIQIATDFSLQPGFVAFPTPSLSGEAALPSTVDVYVNDVLRQRLDADAGPFTIENPPVITGSGELRAVVRDLLGRQTIIVQPFYASPSLLRADLEQYSFEAGMLRDDFGISSNRYDEAFVSGSYRKGYTDDLTLGVHAEASTDRTGFGPRIDWLTPIGGVLSGAVAGSTHDGDSGALAQIGLSWSSDSFSLQLSNEVTTDRFTTLGSSDTVREPWLTSSANLGFNLDEFGSVSLNHTRVDERDRGDFEIVSSHYSLDISGLGVLSANAYRTFGVDSETGFYVGLTVPLGERTTAGATIENSGGLWTTTIRASRNVPSEGGLGLRAEISRGEIERQRAGLTYDSTMGIAELDLSSTHGDNAARLGLRGGAVLMEGDVFLVDPITDSFVLVDVGGFADVTIMRENRPVAETDASGRALITGLRAYEENRISIDPLDLPLSAEIGATDLCVVPCRRSGATAKFPVSPLVAATATIVDAGGSPLPPGTLLRAGTSGYVTPVGFGGEVFITGLDEPRILEAQTRDGACRVYVPAVEPAAIPVRLPPLTCGEISP